MSDLLLFTIGPVQSFIGNSRKTMDMYAGSKLLSELMQGLVSTLEAQENSEVLFPVEPEDGRSTSDMPNRFIAKLQVDDSMASEKIAYRLEKQVRQSFLNRCLELLDGAGIEQRGLDMAKKQLQDFLEVFWVIEPYAEDDYQEIYRRLFQNIQLVKSIRPFQQSTEPWNRKCMLFPTYNAIFVKGEGEPDNKKYPAKINPADVLDIEGIQKLHYQVKQKEALSAIALVKRSYDKKPEIYSLRQMLLRNYLSDEEKDLGKLDLNDLLANAVYDIKNGNESKYDEYDEETWSKAKELCENNVNPSSYYALVKFDGDSMGDEFLKKKTFEEQRDLSRSIGAFAREAPMRFKNHGGLPVYAGGEDFLGFLPVDRLFDCLIELRELFQDKVGLTFSAGIVVAHVMQLLKEAAVAAEKMEELAKQKEGKNAFVIGILKRGGETVIMPPYKFDSGGNQKPELKDVQELMKELISAEYSKSLLYQISKLFQCFEDEGEKPEPHIAEVLIRKAVQSSEINNPEKLVQSLLMFYEENSELQGFLNTLNAVSFLAREVSVCSVS